MSSVGVGGVDLCHEFAVGGARRGEVLVALFELETQVDDALLEGHGLLFELIDALRVHLTLRRTCCVEIGANAER
jgi:hypothetical protein